MNESIAQNSDELENIFTSAFLQYEEQNVIELLDSIFDKNSAEMIETCLNIAKSAAEKCKVKTKFNNTLKHYKKDFAIQKRLEMCTGKISIKNKQSETSMLHTLQIARNGNILIPRNRQKRILSI